ncbi:MAG: PorT family protein [FCB group bacterium]|nr:PorT family protein [FCB group bacterium]
MKYTKVLIVIVCSLCSVLPLSAQDQSGNILLGIKGGINVSELDFDNDFADGHFHSHSSLIGGVFIRYNTSPGFKIQLEFIYTRRGTETDEITYTDAEGHILGSDKTVYMVDYMEIPILAVISTRASYQIYPKFKFGPQIGFKARTEREQPGLSKVGTSPDLSEAKSTLFGFVVGTGVDIRAGSMLIITELNYLYGLSSPGILFANKWRAYSFNIGVALNL